MTTATPDFGSLVLESNDARGNKQSKAEALAYDVALLTTAAIQGMSQLGILGVGWIAQFTGRRLGAVAVANAISATLYLIAPIVMTTWEAMGVVIIAAACIFTISSKAPMSALALYFAEGPA